MPYHVGDPLIYAIDDWHQLVNARSNTAPELRIIVTDFVNSDLLRGVRISIIDPMHGVLAALMPEATGRYVGFGQCGGPSLATVLEVLRQFGFNIILKPELYITAATKTKLEALLHIGFTHVRPAKMISGPGKSFQAILAFNEALHPEFVAQYIRPVSIHTPNIHFIRLPGSEANFTWLDRPMHIESILTDSIPEGR